MNTLYDNILGTIGNTPIVKINRMAPDGVNIYAKLEFFNPMASIKDRLALGIIEQAEQSGALKPGQTVIEATSGNTGIGLAMVCAQKGYPLVVTMAENFSVERRKMMRFLGVKVVLTPAAQKGSGMLAKAIELADKHGWFLCRQFENEANADMHSRTTAPEILSAFGDKSLDYWVTGFGTGGTLKGVSRVLKEKSPNTKIVVCEPDNSQLLASKIPQPDNISHPNFRPHLMQGWTPDFIPKLSQEALDNDSIDQLIAIAGNDAIQCAIGLARKEGIFAGISSGATMAGAIQIAQTAPPGSNILVMIPDTGERYLSTPLFDGIEEQMTEAELEISKSTQGYRFDIAAPPLPAPAKDAEPVEIDEQAKQFMHDITHDMQNPVVFFALEWCEFCWSVRKFFAQCNIPYVSVDLDSVKYQQDNQGGKIRAALSAQTGCVTIPQLFVGGKFVGGATDVFDGYKNGEFQKVLVASNVEFADKDVDPYSFLPKWLQPR
ncbi:MAG: cysteine synthase A [Psychrosphaera sp.]|nr:cysteine synthase A [Psychrosphaera sp.]